MRIATWNINSVRLRLPLLKRLVKEASPDVVCLQETKVEDALFPHEEIAALGYPHRCVRGQKGYNGVAILSRHALASPHHAPLLKPHEARHIAVRLPDGTELHNAYVPAGGDIPDRELNPSYGYKLDFVEALQAWFAAHRRAEDRMILVGDLNIAPHEHDVWSHKQLLKVVSHTPPEIERMTRLREHFSWVDTARHFTPIEEKLYSWWSYRNRDWRKSDRGRRLDHIWVTPPLKPRLRMVKTLKDARDWPQPSDHVPVVLDMD